MTSIRPDVVSLLSDLDFDPAEPPGRQRHLDGRPVTHDEIHLLLTATMGELRASLEYDRLALEYEAQQLTKGRRFHELLVKYASDPDERIRVTIDCMPPADRQEAQQLLDEIGPEFELWLNNR